MALDSGSRQWLIKLFGKSVRFKEPMSKHTYFRVGGPAEAYVAPENFKELVTLIKWTLQKNIPYFVIGDGTNLLVKDRGIHGVVITLKKCLKKITLVCKEPICKEPVCKEKDRTIVAAMAGVKMQTLCSFAIEQGLGGMNFALGIPGTVGGGIMMNAGTACGSMESVLDSVKILLPTGGVQRIEREDLNFSYRKISWAKGIKAEGLKTNGRNRDDHGQTIILEGCFCLYPSDRQKLEKEAEEILKTRYKNQPANLPSAGCFFKNPLHGKTAGQLIESAGLKGKRKGGARISSKHANFIINTGKASAEEILELKELAQETVKKMFDVDLETEVKIIGL